MNAPIQTMGFDISPSQQEMNQSPFVVSNVSGSNLNSDAELG